MITLRELVQSAELQVGQVLIPISAFGYTYNKLEKVFSESVRYFEQWYPPEKEIQVSNVQSGVVIPDCIRVLWIRPLSQGTAFKETVPKTDRKMWSWNPDTKIFKSSGNASSFLVGYVGHYSLGYIPAEDVVVQSLYKEEDELFLDFKGHFKRGTLTVSLIEPITPDSLIKTINLLNSSLEIDPVMGSMLYTGALVKLRTSNTLLSPILADVEYYIIKSSDSNIQLALTYVDAIANNAITLVNVGVGSHTIYRVPFTLKEVLTSYKEFITQVTPDITNHFFNISDFLFTKRVATGDPVLLRTTGTLPTPFTLGTIYYLIVIDDTIIKLASTRENAFLNIPVDPTSLGTGVTTLVGKNDADELEDDKYIHLQGSLGVGEINIYNLQGTIYNSYGLQGDISLSFVNKYKAVKELDLDINYNDFFMKVFLMKFTEGIGRQKMTVKLDGLPVDITADDLVSVSNDLKAEVREFTETRSKWWLFN